MISIRSFNCTKFVTFRPKSGYWTRVAHIYLRILTVRSIHCSWRTIKVVSLKLNKYHKTQAAMCSGINYAIESFMIDLSFPHSAVNKVIDYT